MGLEKMDDFFTNRIDGYEEHQLNSIESAKKFYALTARHLPMEAGCKILDLGCGTGLELNEYFKRNPLASVTGIDLTESMLEQLQTKFPDQDLTLIHDSYFNIEYKENEYDAIVSVESLHHFTQKQKIDLYRKLHEALKNHGYFILTDYMVGNEQEEQQNFEELTQMKKEQHLSDHQFYHYDTPLTREHEFDALIEGGFSRVEVINIWGNTTMLKAYK